MVQFTETPEENIRIVSMFLDLLVIMLQELELGHGEDDEDGGEAPVELSQAERESNNQHKQYLNEETKLECFVPLT